MSAERDLNDILEARLCDVPPLRATVLGDVFDQTRTMPQRRHRLSLHLSTGRSFTVFSAVKFVAAGVIVALFGGFLLAGILAPQQDGRVLPAAVTDSPSLLPTEELLSGMVTEEIEPGVFEVVDDGRRALAHLNADGQGAVSVGSDGSVWLSGGGGGPGLFRPGDELIFDVPAELHGSPQVAPDGSLWFIGQFLDDDMGIYSWDGQALETHASEAVWTFGFDDLAVGPDGTVWVTTTVEATHPRPSLMQLDADDSLTMKKRWADVYAGDADTRSLLVSPDGDVWLRGGSRSGGPEADVLLRFDGSEWDVIELPEGFVDPWTFLPFGIGPDGTLWVQIRGLAAGAPDARGLARFDDPGWTVFTEPDDGSGWQGWFSAGKPVWLGEDLFAIAPDGGVWHPGRPTEEDPCGGVVRFDGTSWASFVDDACIGDLAIAPDGSVWLLGDGLYVITPEAVAAKE